MENEEKYVIAQLFDMLLKNEICKFLTGMEYSQVFTYTNIFFVLFELFLSHLISLFIQFRKKNIGV